LVFTKSGDKYAASARSVKGFDVYNALDACAEHLEQFGGHMYAAGMTLKAENYSAFKDAFEKCVEETILPEMRTPEIEIDAEINFSDITPKLIRILKQFEPYGPQNMTPVFMSSNVTDTGYAKTLGAEDEHLRLFVKQNSSEGLAAIGFGLGKKIDLTKNHNPFQLAYTVCENEWNDKISTQLMLKDIRTNEK
jgi:single-stranded-DNA-specific exonuclease